MAIRNRNDPPRDLSPGEGQREAPPEDGSGRPALELRRITKRFPGVLANDDVSLTVRRGEIHGLLGENGAGKSTLMNIAFGLYAPDAGEIEVDGSPVRLRNPREAMDVGIGMVHQHFMLVPDMTVAENVAMAPSLLPKSSNLSRVGDGIRQLSKRFGLAVEPDAVVEKLSLGEQQRVEITKMLYGGADVLILDEPSAALTPPEWQDLARFVRSLADGGCAVVLITHKLDELFGIADRCTVLRDGRVVDTLELERTDKRTLARMMVGRDVTLVADRLRLEPGPVRLKVSELTLRESGLTLLDDISFEVRASEVLGFAGVSGNGQTELVETLIGLRRPTSGTIEISGEAFHGGPTDFMLAGGAVIPENRHRDGVSVELPLRDNLMLKEIDRAPYASRGLINGNEVKERCEELVRTYDVKAPGLDTRIGQLSGGNQQKAVLARELGREPSLLIAAQPTRGLDVGAIEFVYGQLTEQKRRGSAILLFSIELDEVLSLSDRIAVIANGKIMSILDNEDIDAERIGLLMGGERED